MSSTNARRSPYRLIPWLILGVVGLSFSRVIGNGITPTDDRATIFQNPRMAPTDHPPTFFGDDGASWYWQHSDTALYMPVTSTIWFLLAKLTWVQTPDENGFRLDPHIFHAASLLVHILNALLVYCLLRELLRDRRVDSVWPALAGALLFGLHPLQVETVAWISGMKDLLYCGFSLSALLAYVKSVSPLTDEKEFHWKRICSYLGGIALMILGMLCKPTAMVVPLLAFILSYLILHRPFTKTILSLIPYVIAAIPLMIVAKLLQPAIGVPMPPLWQRPIVAGASLSFYLDKLIVPVPLTIEYGWRPVVMLHKSWFWWIAAIPVVIGVFLFLLRRRRPWLLAGAMVGVAALLPVLGFSPFLFQYFSTVTDHYVVLAMLGPAIALAGLLIYRDGRSHPLALGTVIAVLLIYAGLSFRQLGYWRDEKAVLTHMVDVSADTAVAHNGLGVYYLNHGDLKKAEIELAARGDDPLYFQAAASLAQAFAEDGQPKQAIAAFHEMVIIAGRLPIEARPNDVAVLLGLANNAIEFGHRRDVPLYLLEIPRMWFAKNFESWLGGPMVKYLPQKT